jgi:hypothetical protein
VAFWDSKEQKITYFPNELDPNHPHWMKRDCGCCMGSSWGSGAECHNCKGEGFYYINLKSGVKATYPGGSFLGKISKEELRKLNEQKFKIEENGQI